MEERFVYNGWNLVAILNGSDVLQKHYTWGLDISGSEQGAGGVGGLLAVYDTSSSYFAYYDGNGNITAYSDGSNNSVATYFYSPFGAITEKSGLKKDDFNFKFSTKFFDNLANLYYYGFRYYSPRFARWINRDPIGINGGINLYGMVGNDAVNKWDYLGWKISAADKAEKCKKAGGTPSGRRCCCGDSKTYMNPKSQCCYKGKIKYRKNCVIFIVPEHRTGAEADALDPSYKPSEGQKYNFLTCYRNKVNDVLLKKKFPDAHAPIKNRLGGNKKLLVPYDNDKNGKKRHPKAITMTEAYNDDLAKLKGYAKNTMCKSLKECCKIVLIKVKPGDFLGRRWMKQQKIGHGEVVHRESCKY